jgi:hypothetical protein
MKNITNTILGKDYIITPKQYLKLLRKNPNRILNTTFIPPKLGEKHFGKFKIKIF